MSLNRELMVFKRRTKRSREIYGRASSDLPLGVGSNVRSFRPILPYPIYFSRGSGPFVWDSDGNKYIDFDLAFGSLILGHADESILKTIREASERGYLFGGDFEGIEEVARILLDSWHMDMLRFCNSGLEGTLHALRIARAFTSRSKVLKFQGCYHGAHDQLLFSVRPPKGMLGYGTVPLTSADSRGIPRSIRESVLVATYNSLESVEYLLRKYMNEVAAIIVEPIALNMGVVPPKEGFLRGLRKLADEYNVVLIFDETKTAVKFAKGGATELFSVKPDIAVLGKSVAGGLPFSSILGKEEIMRVLETGVLQSGTFSGNPLSLSAVKAVMSKVNDSTRRKMFYLGERLAKGFMDCIQDRRANFIVQSIGPTFHVYTGISEPVENFFQASGQDNALWRLYWLYFLNRNYIIESPLELDQGNVSVKHEEEQVDRAIELFDSFLSEADSNQPKGGELPSSHSKK